MTADATVERLDLDGAARVHSAWQDLAERSLEPSVFNEPAFLIPAARHLAGRVRPVFLAVWKRAAGTRRLVGLCALAGGRWPGLPARVWTHPQATAAFPLLDRTDAPAALAALLQAIGQGRGRPAGLLMTGLVRDGPTADALAGAGVSLAWMDSRSRAVLLRDGEAPGMRGGARKELRRQWNRLAEAGAACSPSAREPQAVTAALERFLALEAKGWKGRRGTALGSTPATRAFAVAAVTGLAAAGRCRIDAIEIDGRPLAMGIVLTSHDRDFFWKTAYDEDFARFSPGLQLASHLTDLQLANAAVVATDSCAIAGHSMIDRLWPDRWEVVDCIVSTGGAGRSAFARVCAVERLHRRLRARAKVVRGALARR